MSTAAVSPCTDNFFSQLVKGNALACSTTFQNYETSSAQDSIQSVADNAATYYGPDSTVSDVAATTAAQQEAQSPSDVANTTQAVASSTVGQIFTTCPDGGSGLAIPGLPCINFSYIAYGVLGLVALYVLALVASFVPRPR